MARKKKTMKATEPIQTMTENELVEVGRVEEWPEPPASEHPEENKQLFDEQSVDQKKRRTVINHAGGRVINAQQIAETGMLQELNRTFFHPIGMDLRPLKGGKTSAFIVVDMIDKMDELKIDYGKTVQSGKAIEHVEKFQQLTRERNGLRKRAVGYIVQPVR